jgi:hypothetical protein
MKHFILIAAFVLMTWNTWGQPSDSTKNVKDFQISFIYPLGTGGTSSIENTYNLSFNILGGATYSSEQAEFSGFLNINKSHFNGAQLSGFLNVNGVKGGEKHSRGAQFAGFANVNNTRFNGGQFAGFYNQTKSLQGAQIAGFINLTEVADRSTQVAGFINTATKGATSTQVAGGINYAQVIEGAQVGGLINTTLELKSGAQVAGLGNTAVKADSSVQVAGLFNVAPTSEVNTQVAGLFNVGRHVRGVQIAGLVNYCDSINGVPIALVSVVRHHGYRAFEVSVSDWNYGQVSYKMGVSDLYSIYSISKLPGAGSRWSFGGGFGHEARINEKWNLNLEVTLHQELWIAEDKAPKTLYIDRTNLVNQWKFAMSTPLVGKARLSVAPTFNTGWATQKQGALGEDLQPHYKWDSLLGTKTGGKTKISAWFGFNTGIQF